MIFFKKELKLLCKPAGERVNTGDHTPVHSRPYQIAPRWFEPLKKEVNTLLEAGIISHSTSPWSSPIITEAKSDGSVRLCVDYRGLNALTTADPYQMPLIEQVLNVLAEAVVLSKLDLNKGFHQVPIVTEDRPLKLPFPRHGRNSTITACRLVSKMALLYFKGCLIECCLILWNLLEFT